jgi:hypothetical protein
MMPIDFSGIFYAGVAIGVCVGLVVAGIVAAVVLIL